jgi:hypothetical protein
MTYILLREHIADAVLFGSPRRLQRQRKKPGCTYRGIAIFKAERIVCCDYRPSRITSSDDHNLLLIVDPGSTELNEVAATGKLHLDVVLRPGRQAPSPLPQRASECPLRHTPKGLAGR